MSDLTPWRVGNDHPEPPRRYRSIIPAPGWFYVYAWWDTDAPGEPPAIVERVAIAAFGILRGPRHEDDDTVVPLTPFEDPASLSIPDTDMSRNCVVLGLYSQAELDAPESPSNIRAAADRAVASKRASNAKELAQRRVVVDFVNAQPSPASFAASMRAAGCVSLYHAHLCISHAGGDPAAAIKYASVPPFRLQNTLRSPR